jgi:hypothetical protein
MNFYSRNRAIITSINRDYRIVYSNIDRKERFLVGAGVLEKYFEEKIVLKAFEAILIDFPKKYTVWDRKFIKIEFFLK